jgi:pimeloyl-ACP methyl ester carboxylesterase
VPDALRTVVERFDPDALPLPERPWRVRLNEQGARQLDVLLASGQAPRVVEADPREQPDATLTADSASWQALADDPRAGLSAFRRGRLRLRGNLHLGVGLLAATGGGDPGALRFRDVQTKAGRISAMEAGTGEATVLLVHGLGATKLSMLTTLGALATTGRFRAVAIDLPGFGDSHKPLRAAYDPAYFARALCELLDALEVDRAHVVGNSLGGRIAIELGLEHPDRVGRLGLLAPSLAWLRARPWARPLRWIRPELGLLQPAPRRLIDPLVRMLVPGSNDDTVTAVAVDEFLRGYLDPRGRVAFYAAARHIYLEEPRGRRGFWDRLPELEPDALFVWGRNDQLVPLGFARHVEACLPRARHLELDCGHVPQLERPGRTHAALLDFLG